MSGELDRVKAGLLRLVEDMLSRADFHALYPCTVVAQNADNTLELQPDSTKIPPLSNVRIRLGIPGAVATVAAGARVLLTFEAGNPKAPVATLWDTGTLVALSLNGGTMGLAKADHTHTLAITAGQLQGATPSLATTVAPIATSAPSSNTTLLKVT